MMCRWGYVEAWCRLVIKSGASGVTLLGFTSQPITCPVSKKKKEVLPLYFLVHLDVFPPGPCASLSTLDPLVSISISS